MKDRMTTDAPRMDSSKMESKVDIGECVDTLLVLEEMG